jgi:hypothetical protein
VYHVENFLLDPEKILAALRVLHRSECEYDTPNHVEVALKKLLLADAHLKPYARALLEAEMASRVEEARKQIYSDKANETTIPAIPPFAEFEEDARNALEEAIKTGRWQQEVRGRRLLRSFCGELNLSYKVFRNVLIDQFDSPPPMLAVLMTDLLER